MSEVDFVEGHVRGDSLLADPDEEHCEEERHVRAIEDAELERTLDVFTDEPSIHHNTLPESDSEGEDGVGERSLKDIRRGDRILYQGQVFFNREVFIEAVLDHALKAGRNIKQYRYDKTNIGYNCVGSNNCEWRIYCAVKPKSDEWEVRVFKDKHSCVPNGVCEMLKVLVIARLFIDKIRDEPEYYLPMKTEELIMEKWKIKVSRPQCQADRNKAMRCIEREYDLQFRRLRDYGAEILKSNPDSTVAIETLTNAEGLDVFNRFYVCFDCVRRTWKDTCRPLIGVDGCFLRSKMKGQLLVVLDRDADNSIYPIAWGVVQVENTANWIWFVKKLKADLSLEGGEGYVLISDRQKGLIRAVEEELPHIEHRMCVRHIYANLKTKHGKKPDMKPLVWRIAWSYNEAEYKAILDRLLVYDRGVYEDVVKSNPATWCRAFYKIGSHCEDVENNSTESFNATIVKAREKPMVPMLEMIARLAMVRISKRYEKAIGHRGVCTPYVNNLLALELPAAAECRVFRSTNMMFAVLESGCSYQVSLETRSCSCRKWDIRGIPCQHAYAVILNRKYAVENFVSHCLRTAMWIRTYSEGLIPTRGAPFWPTDSGCPVHKPPSPPQPGRKKKSKKQKRKKGINESPTKKKKRSMHCRICGSSNHNCRFHKKQVTQGEASQGQITEASQGEITQA